MRKNSKSRRIAFTAVFAAFSIAFLYLASIFPTGQLGFLGVASLFGIAAVLEYGIAGGLFVFAATALVGLIIVPSKSLVLFYALFFGYYPVIKALAEKVPSRVVEWVIKLTVFNAALTLLTFVFTSILLGLGFTFSGLARTVGLYLICNAVFVLFDIGISRVIVVYMAKIFPKLHSK